MFSFNSEEAGETFAENHGMGVTGLCCMYYIILLSFAERFLGTHKCICDEIIAPKTKRSFLSPSLEILF